MIKPPRSRYVVKPATMLFRTSAKRRPPRLWKSPSGHPSCRAAGSLQPVARPVAKPRAGVSVSLLGLFQNSMGPIGFDTDGSEIGLETDPVPFAAAQARRKEPQLFAANTTVSESKREKAQGREMWRTLLGSQTTATRRVWVIS